MPEISIVILTLSPTSRLPLPSAWLNFISKSLRFRNPWISAPLIAPRIDIGALQDQVELHLASDSVHGEVAPDARGILVERLDPCGLVRDLRERIDIEEIRGAQVRVALLRRCRSTRL